MIRQLESKSFLFFFLDHLRSTLGITCGRGSFAVHFGDHLRSRDHLQYCTSSSVLKSDVQWHSFSPFQQRKSGSQSHAYGQTSDSSWEILKIANDR